MRENKSREARKLFESGMALVDIAKKLEVPPGTVRRWKSEQKWSSERSEKKGERSTKKSERSEKASRQQEKRSKEQDNFDVENSELTEKQRLFCSYYVRCFNATKAYQKAYECSYNTARTEGSKALAKPCIQKEIRKLKQDKKNQEFLSEEDIFQKYIDIAFADITDYVEFDKTGVRLKNSGETDGTIISEVKKGKDGITLKLADRMKALQWLADHMDFATPEQKARLELLRAQTLKAKAAGGYEDDEDDGVEIIFR
ncbi:MAG: terminase small subunit, partial [Lachnospiraceae bacterium]|nr:terminase small subunit [Lachnospiraceae bacterium]